MNQACKENRGISKNVEVVLSHLDEKKIEKRIARTLVPYVTIMLIKG